MGLFDRFRKSQPIKEVTYSSREMVDFLVESVPEGVRESAVRDKPLLVYGLARNRRSPKRPSEPRPSGVHPEEDAVDNSREASIALACGISYKLLVSREMLVPGKPCKLRRFGTLECWTPRSLRTSGTSRGRRSGAGSRLAESGSRNVGRAWRAMLAPFQGRSSCGRALGGFYSVASFGSSRFSADTSER